MINSLFYATSHKSFNCLYNTKSNEIIRVPVRAQTAFNENLTVTVPTSKSTECTICNVCISTANPFRRQPASFLEYKGLAQETYSSFRVWSVLRRGASQTSVRVQRVRRSTEGTAPRRSKTETPAKSGRPRAISGLRATVHRATCSGFYDSFTRLGGLAPAIREPRGRIARDRGVPFSSRLTRV